MKKDPGQKNNVIKNKSKVVKKMQAAYDKFWIDTKPLMVNEEVPMSKIRPYHVWFEKQSKGIGIPEWTEPEL